MTNRSIYSSNPVNTNWDGFPVTLHVNQNVNMPQTSSGTMVLGYFNQSPQNNQGQITITSGGGAPESLPANALTNQPEILMNNWEANNLSITNTSLHENTPIWVSAFGPGVPGQYPGNLPIGGNPVPLGTTQSVQGTAFPQHMQLVMAANTASLTIFAIIGGPQDEAGNNGYVVAVNYSRNSGPGGDEPPPGYYATTTNNTYAFPFNWGSSLIYVVNMSPSTASGANVLLRAL